MITVNSVYEHTIVLLTFIFASRLLLAFHHSVFSFSDTLSAADWWMLSNSWRNENPLEGILTRRVDRCIAVEGESEDVVVVLFSSAP